MAVRRIVYCGDARLRRKAPRVRENSDDLHELLAELRETMLEADGLGLAGAQVGECLAVVVVRADSEGTEVIDLINPRIVEQEGEQDGHEGCLRLPTLRGMVLRPSRVVVEAFAREGEEIEVAGAGLMARCLAHELDHLQGRLFIDAVDPESLAWLRPDRREDSGYRVEPTTLAEAQEAFDRLRSGREE